jgi:hypothetical protein
VGEHYRVHEADLPGELRRYDVGRGVGQAREEEEGVDRLEPDFEPLVEEVGEERCGQEVFFDGVDREEG